MSDEQTEIRFLGAEAAIQKSGLQARITPAEWVRRFDKVRHVLSEKQVSIYDDHEAWMKQRQAQPQETSAA